MASWPAACFAKDVAPKTLAMPYCSKTMLAKIVRGEKQVTILTVQEYGECSLTCVVVKANKGGIR
jgi:hypothetical protein